MKKIFKFLIIIAIIVFIAVCSFCIYCGNVISGIDESFLKNANLSIKTEQTSILDSSDNVINQINNKSKNAVEIENLHDYTLNAFIAIEDRDFYKHKGINPKRILKAGLKNLQSGFNKEGASTITQQLIKNTVLSSEKTFDRKIKEAYLATRVEQNYSKKEILETYLNVVYFGSGAYGIESAANTFFDCKAQNLSLAQSATLAGLLKSPKNYSPYFNFEKCVERRNLVLSKMLEYNFITEEEYQNAKNEKLIISESNTNANELYIRLALKQASEQLNLSEKDIANSGYKIYTYLDTNLSKQVKKSFDKLLKNESKNKQLDSSLILIDNQSLGVNFIISNKQTDPIKRQPASLIKPLLCYAPAFDLDILAPATPILDEQTSFNNYTPKNADENYDGWISTREALIKSKNIPAVKVLEYVGTNKAKSYMEKCDIDFDKSDTHLALALGSMKYGVTPLNIANAYTVFANNGKYSKCSFIRKIENEKGAIIYQHNKQSTQVYKPETCYMINDILKNTSTNGTAKRLSNYKNICAKTGTNGNKNKKENTDAWCVVYNSEKTVCSWTGNTSGNSLNNLSVTQNGSTVGAKFCSIVLENINKTPKPFLAPSNIVESFVSSKEVNGQKLLFIEEDDLQKKSAKKEIFTEKYLSKLQKMPKISQTNIKLQAKNVGNVLELSFNSVNEKNYILYKKKDNKTVKLAEILGQFPTTKYVLKTDFDNAEFYIELKENDATILSNTIKTFNKNLSPVKKKKMNLKSWLFN